MDLTIMHICHLPELIKQVIVLYATGIIFRKRKKRTCQLRLIALTVINLAQPDQLTLLILQNISNILVVTVITLLPGLQVLDLHNTIAGVEFTRESTKENGLLVTTVITMMRHMLPIAENVMILALALYPKQIEKLNLKIQDD
jgi:hypothetical protein